MNLEKNSIENIDGLNNIKSLKQLNLRKNKIENVESLKNLTNLTTLELAGNKIQEKDIKELNIFLKNTKIHTT